MKHEKPVIVATPAPAPKPAPVVEEPATVCSVCGQPGNLSGAAGLARWHAACEVSHPAVIAKVKARA